MPHLIFQTNFPVNEESAEISFFGNVERETVEALQSCTFSALRNGSTADDKGKPLGYLRPSPYSPDALRDQSAWVMGVPPDDSEHPQVRCPFLPPESFPHAGAEVPDPRPRAGFHGWTRLRKQGGGELSFLL
eukprot:2866802-Rhodomonas_salina.1